MVLIGFVSCRNNSEGKTYSMTFNKKQQFFQELVLQSTNPADTLLYLKVLFNDDKPYLKLKEDLDVGVAVRRRKTKDLIFYEIVFQRIKQKEKSPIQTQEGEVLKTFINDPNAKTVTRNLVISFSDNNFKLLSNNFNNDQNVKVLLSAFEQEFSSLISKDGIIYRSEISDSDSIFFTGGHYSF